MDTPEAWASMVGAHLGPGQWITLDQSKVDAFAECTSDHQWIHKAGAETPFGGPIAHGLLSLSLLPALMKGVLPTQSWMGHELNCGFNRVRFVSPVRVGARVRATAELVSVTRLPSSQSRVGVETVVAIAVHGDGGRGDKPVLVAEWVTRQYSRAS